MSASSALAMRLLAPTGTAKMARTPCRWSGRQLKSMRIETHRIADRVDHAPRARKHHGPLVIIGETRRRNPKVGEPSGVGQEGTHGLIGQTARLRRGVFEARAGATAARTSMALNWAQHQAWVRERACHRMDHHDHPCPHGTQNDVDDTKPQPLPSRQRDWSTNRKRSRVVGATAAGTTRLL